jgi:hypothetical protein
MPGSTFYNSRASEADEVAWLSTTAERICPVAGIKFLLGVDPKQDYKDKVAKVTLR